MERSRSTHVASVCTRRRFGTTEVIYLMKIKDLITQKKIICILDSKMPQRDQMITKPLECSLLSGSPIALLWLLSCLLFSWAGLGSLEPWFPKNPEKNLGLSDNYILITRLIWFSFLVTIALALVFLTLEIDKQLAHAGRFDTPIIYRVILASYTILMPNFFLTVWASSKDKVGFLTRSGYLKNNLSRIHLINWSMLSSASKINGTKLKMGNCLIKQMKGNGVTLKRFYRISFL